MMRRLCGPAARRALLAVSGRSAQQTARTGWWSQQRQLNSSSTGGGNDGLPKEFDDSDRFAQPEPFDFPADPSALLPLDATTTAAAEAVLAAPAYLDKPSNLVMEAINSIHTVLGVPYWEAIVLITLGVRIALIPMSIMQLKSSATLGIIKPEIDKIQASMIQDPDKTMERKQHYEAQVKALFKEHNFKPSRMWMPFLQLPVFVGFFVGIREMGSYFPGFKTGGALWFTDLSASDPTYILPVINGLSMLLMFETGIASNPQADKKQAEVMRWVMRAASFAMIPLMISMPNGLFVHWGVNNCMSVAQTAILANPNVKKYFDIPVVAPAPPSSPAPSSPFVKLFEENQRILNEKRKGGK